MEQSVDKNCWKLSLSKNGVSLTIATTAIVKGTCLRVNNCLGSMRIYSRDFWDLLLLVQFYVEVFHVHLLQQHRKSP